MLELRPPPPPSPQKPIVLGLLGGIASGKSTVARALQDQGFRWIDADRIAQSLLGSPQVRDALVERFGPQILDEEGGVKRKTLASLVFSRESERKFLEKLVHPEVRREMEAALEDAARSGQACVLDVPLLLEGGLYRLCDILVYVQVPEEERKKRAIARGMASEDWEARENIQAPMTEKRGISHFELSNSGGKKQLLQEVHALLTRLRDLGFLREE